MRLYFLVVHPIQSCFDVTGSVLRRLGFVSRSSRFTSLKCEFCFGRRKDDKVITTGPNGCCASNLEDIRFRGLDPSRFLCAFAFWNHLVNHLELAMMSTSSIYCSEVIPEIRIDSISSSISYIESSSTWGFISLLCIQSKQPIYFLEVCILVWTQERR